MSNLIQLTLQRRKLFKTINLESVHDPNLSWKAKGLHIYLMSRPDGWKLNYADLVCRSTDGRGSVNTAVQELKQYGYLRIKRVRNTRGKYTHLDWTVTESPTDLPLQLVSSEKKPPKKNPQAEKPQSENSQGSKGGFREKEVIKEKGTPISPEKNFGPGGDRNEADAELDATPDIRKSTTFPAGWYKQALGVYQHLKNLTLSGPEYDPLYYELKTIFLAGHHITEVTGMMWWLHNEKWPNWRLYTIRHRIAEWKAGQLQSTTQIRKKRSQKQSLDEAKGELQSFVDAEPAEAVSHASG